MRALIAEDESHIADDLIRRLTRLWPELEISAIVTDGIAAQRALMDLSLDVAFLDIRMPGMNGLQAARSAQPGCRVVFVTAHDDHAVEAFEQAAVDYLLKPVSDERLEKSVRRLRQATHTNHVDLLNRLQSFLPTEDKPAPLRWLRAQVGDRVHIVGVDEVCYFQSAYKYTIVTTRQSEFPLRTPIKELAKQLNHEHFWQIHRGTIVNIQQISSAQRELSGRLTLTLKDCPATLTVSRAYAHLFRQS
jgi:DNA-binding LytR/AlgR family response regulator